MTKGKCALLGAPVQSGAGRGGCLMGPDAYRTAGLATSIASLGYEVSDLGDVTLPKNTRDAASHPNRALHHLEETAAWTSALTEAAYQAKQVADIPIFMGGDHSLSIGTVAGVTRHAAENGRQQFVLWLDAHPDIHDLNSTESGNLHGTPVAYFTGLGDFDGHYPAPTHLVPPANLCMLGIRSVDPAENARLLASDIDVHDMRAIDEFGIKAPLAAFLHRVTEADGALHVSLDVDFLDPAIAPAVGTTVPGGATFREAHLVMELLCDSGLVTSLDLVELNPFLDERGRTAKLMTDLTASLLGRKVLDRPTRSF